MRKNSQADRAQDNSDSYIRERLRLPKGDQGEITIRKEKKNISNLYSYMRERARLPRGDQRSEFCSSCCVGSLLWTWKHVRVKHNLFLLSALHFLTSSLRTKMQITYSSPGWRQSDDFFWDKAPFKGFDKWTIHRSPATYLISTVLVDNQLSSIVVYPK